MKLLIELLTDTTVGIWIINNNYWYWNIVIWPSMYFNQQLFSTNTYTVILITPCNTIKK